VKRREPIDPSKALGKRAQKGVAWSFMREGVSELLLFPMSMVLGRLLSPLEFGVAAAAAFFIQLAQRLSELGFNAVLVRSKEVKPIHLSTVFCVQIVLGALMYAVMVASAPFIGAFFAIPEPKKVVSIAALSFLIMPFGAVPAALLQRRMEYRKNTVVDWSQLLVMSVTNVVLAYLGFSYMSIIGGRLASNATATGLRIYFARWRPSIEFSRSALREILPAGSGFFMRRLLDFSAQNGDNLVVGRVMGLTALGLYDKAYSTMNRFLSRMNTGGPGVMFRIFAMIHEEPERFRRAYQKVTMSAAMLGFPVFAALAAMAPQLMEVMFGANWRVAGPPFALLCIAGCFKLLNSYVSSATQAAGQIWSEVGRQVLYVLLIGVGILAFKDWGTTGAAAGVLAATAIMSVLMHLLLQRITHLGWAGIVRPLIPGLLCAAGAAGVVFLVEVGLRQAVESPSPWLLVFCQAPAAALFVVLFALFAPLADLRILVIEICETLVPKSIRRHRWAQSYLSPGTAPTGEEST
jgi:O-antigen/teichoic acid export membrane protein